MRVEIIELKGKYYPSVLSLNAIEKIEDAYVPYDNLPDLLMHTKKYNVNSITAIKDILYIFITEGIAYCNFKGMKMKDEFELETTIPEKKELYGNLEVDEVTKILDGIYRTIIASKKK